MIHRSVLYHLPAYKVISAVLLSQLSSVLSTCRQTDGRFVRLDETILFEVLLPAHFLQLCSCHLCLHLPLTIYEEEISGQSKLTAKCSLSYDFVSTLPVLPALKQAAERRPPSSKPDLCWTPSIIHRFSRLWQEMHGHISSLLALNLVNLLSHSEHTQHTQMHAFPLERLSLIHAHIQDREHNITQAIKMYTQPTQTHALSHILCSLY